MFGTDIFGIPADVGGDFSLTFVSGLFRLKVYSGRGSDTGSEKSVGSKYPPQGGWLPDILKRQHCYESQFFSIRPLLWWIFLHNETKGKIHAKTKNE